MEPRLILLAKLLPALGARIRIRSDSLHLPLAFTADNHRCN